MAKLRGESSAGRAPEGFTFRRPGSNVQRTQGGKLPRFRQDEKERRRVSGLIDRTQREQRRSKGQDGVRGGRSIPKPLKPLFRPNARLDKSQVKDRRTLPKTGNRRRLGPRKDRIRAVRPNLPAVPQRRRTRPLSERAY